MDEDIFGLEGKVIRLKADYEQYFMRVLKREPLKLQEEIERTILRYTGVPINNTSLKFKFHSIVAKYTSYKQYWKRTLKMVEEGTYKRRAEGCEKPQITPAAANPQPVTKAKTAAEKTFDKYLASRKECNQSTKGVTFDKFQKSIATQQKKLGAEGKGVKVFIKDGKTKIAFTSPKAKKK